uniref:Putative secreted protein n=1 Tax=Anopheles darlingi TaxID=43151 RepID=A0A2M4DL75_ANODA
MRSRPHGNASSIQCSLTICIFLATPSICAGSNRIRCAMRNGGVEPSLLLGNELPATFGLPYTKCIWTAAWSFFNANRPCHITG